MIPYDEAAVKAYASQVFDLLNAERGRWFKEKLASSPDIHVLGTDLYMGFPVCGGLPLGEPDDSDHGQIIALLYLCGEHLELAIADARLTHHPKYRTIAENAAAWIEQLGGRTYGELIGEPE